jgi:hypothetical protein
VWIMSLIGGVKSVESICWRSLLVHRNRFVVSRSFADYRELFQGAGLVVVSLLSVLISCVVCRFQKLI